MASQTTERERVRGYLLSQGKRYDYFEIWSRCVRARLEVLDSLQGVSDDQARFKPADGEWSISEVALHVLNGSRRVARLVELLAEGQPASSDRIDPPHEETNLKVEELHNQRITFSTDRCNTNCCDCMTSIDLCNSTACCLAPLASSFASWAKRRAPTGTLQILPSQEIKSPRRCSSCLISNSLKSLSSTSPPTNNL